MITQYDINRLTDADVYDTDGDKIGSVGQVYLDNQTGSPEWLTVRTGLFGTKETFVPLSSATVTDDRVTVAYDKGFVKDAPRIDADGPLSHAEERELYTYYSLSAESRYDGDGYQAGHRNGQGRGHSKDDAMTRSEEHLIADTRTEEAGKARLRKYVVTEQEQVSVAVSHEEARLEREPITEANRAAAYDGPEITEAEHEVTLHAERPVVATETVPVERVRLAKETVRDQETVSGEVRKEQIEYDGPETGSRTRR